MAKQLNHSPLSNPKMAIKNSAQYSLHFLSSLKEIAAPTWNDLLHNSYPFLSYDFLLALEESGCTSPQSGWQPHHVIIKSTVDDEQKIVALMPLYLKTNSTGEYIFDWAWADAYQQHGIQYYPKFVTSIPFTPSAGPRICVDKNQNYDDIVSFIAKELPLQANILGVSSWHILFPEPALNNQLQKLGIQSRLGCQYQWHNHNFNNFEHFLEKFSSRKRKNIKKERQQIIDSKICFEVLEGKDIQAEHWEKFYLFYQSTYFVRGRQPYLNKDFFLRIGSTMPESLLLILAIKDGEYIAGALSFKDNDTLYGRFWGCTEEHRHLHFETCYYQGIEYCIKNNLQRFDSGAQGEHKIQRGFEPVPTYSNHWIAHPQFDEAIAQFLSEEENYIADYIKRAEQTLPFKKEA